MLPHPEIVIRAPDRDVLGLVVVVTGRAWKCAGLSLQIGEDAITAFSAKSFELVAKEKLIIHDRLLPSVASMRVLFLADVGKAQRQSAAS